MSWGEGGGGGGTGHLYQALVGQTFELKSAVTDIPFTTAKSTAKIG